MSDDTKDTPPTGGDDEATTDMHRMSSNLRIEDVSLTDTGLARSENEDCHISLPQQQVWLVADGMDGHDNGRFASQAIVDAARSARWRKRASGSGTSRRGCRKTSPASS